MCIRDRLSRVCRPSWRRACVSTLTPMTQGPTAHRFLCTKPDDRTENIATIPNALCVFRLAASPCVAYLICTQSYPEAFWLLGVASFTDALDGFIARNVPGQKSHFGAVIDPLADKALLTCTAVTLAWSGLMPCWLVGGIIGRDVALMTGGFYLRYTSLPAPKTWARYWDGRIVSAEVTPTDISKVHTVLALGTMGASLAAPVFGLPSQEVLTGLFYLTGVTTVASGLSYATSKTAVRFIK
eukprot:TRINITY_DN1893_c0_g1_i1.p2 TRINITY_DN1893_c0_g1~~TRINITY_DN1893_c0_g1_i1.p2  ORF type:complete len:241 (+),score=41.01 TRINITY_DN1893_c0_g1_i1:124-846(+)